MQYLEAILYIFLRIIYFIIIHLQLHFCNKCTAELHAHWLKDILLTYSYLCTKAVELIFLCTKKKFAAQQISDGAKKDHSAEVCWCRWQHFVYIFRVMSHGWQQIIPLEKQEMLMVKSLYHFFEYFIFTDTVS